jgi:assimilatory nitrate reductase catalytic subunit
LSCHPEVRAQPASKGYGDSRFFAGGNFFTPDRMARFIAPEPPALKEATSPAFPLRLNTGRIRDQWHTMTRTGMSPRLATHLPEPFVEVHPNDADTVGLVDAGYARVSTAHGACVMKVVVSDSQQRGSLFVPIHWSAETSSAACIGDLVSPQTDPFSGQPEAKATPAAIVAVSFSLRGFTRTRQAITLPEGTWWARVSVADGQEYRLASSHGPMVWHDFAHRAFAGDAQLAEQLDGATYRAAALLDGEMEGYLCLAPPDTPLQWDALAFSADDTCNGLPVCKSTVTFSETEAVICACFGVEIDAVRQAVACGAAKTVADIGTMLRAGTNCGSCLPELKRIIVHERISHTG